MFYSGEIIDNTYRIEREIGSGGTGIVFLAFHLRLRKFVVLKKLKNGKYNIDFLRTEVDTLKNLHHMYLPQVYDYVKTSSDIFTVIDYINGCDLKEYKNSNYIFTEGQLIKWLRQLCEVISYMHSQNPPVLHMDIKPSNIIIDENGDVCLIDFGIALFWGDRLKGLSSGFASPEQIWFAQSVVNGNPDYSRYPDERSDIYSLGASFYYLITGVKPRSDSDLSYIDEFSSMYSDAFLSIIKAMIRYERSERFQKVSDITYALNNIKKYDKEYKKQFTAMMVSSIVGSVMLVAGILMLFSGMSSVNFSNYNRDYEKFIEYYSSGNSDSAVSLGNSILNNSDYRGYVKDHTKTQILHAIGDCFYMTEDYINAAKYYGFALENVSNEDKYAYYRDYALAQVHNGNIDKANEVLNAIGDSSYAAVINAQIHYMKGEYKEALDLLLPITNQPDNGNKAEALSMCGEIYNAQGDLSQCADFFERAYNVDKSLESLRKAAFNYLAAYNSSDTSDNSKLYKAKSMYKLLYNSYYCSKEDRINLAQCYRQLADYSSARSVLTKLESRYPNDIEVNIQMAFLLDDMGDSEGVKEYCGKVRTLLDRTDEYDIDDESIQKIKELYNKYSNGIW